MPGLNLTGCFGMCEMEMAAERILKKVRTVQSWNVSFTVDGWEYEMERDGFLCLIAGGFLANRPCSAAHGEFVPTNDFVDRLLEKLEPSQFAKLPRPSF